MAEVLAGLCLLFPLSVAGMKKGNRGRADECESSSLSSTETKSVMMSLYLAGLRSKHVESDINEDCEKEKKGMGHRTQ